MTKNFYVVDKNDDDVKRLSSKPRKESSLKKASIAHAKLTRVLVKKFKSFGKLIGQ